jgi:hypothetical protein
MTLACPGAGRPPPADGKGPWYGPVAAPASRMQLRWYHAQLTGMENPWKVYVVVSTSRVASSCLIVNW